MIALIHFSPITEILITHNNFVSMRPYTELDEYEQIIVSRMLKEKTLLTADELWALQSSFYQTIVSVLIALNAAIIAVAYFIIRTSSTEEARREAAARFDEYINGNDISKAVRKAASKKILEMGDIYGDLFDGHDELKKVVESNKLEISYLQDDIDAISSRLSLLDSSEESGNGQIT